MFAKISMSRVMVVMVMSRIVVRLLIVRLKLLFVRNGVVICGCEVVVMIVSVRIVVV